jgi:hypothetical protein
MTILPCFHKPQGYRATQAAIVEATEQAAEVDQMKGSTLEEISQMVDQISREYRSKQAQLQPLSQELKVRASACYGLLLSFMICLVRFCLLSCVHFPKVTNLVLTAGIPSPLLP